MSCGFLDFGLGFVWSLVVWFGWVGDSWWLLLVGGLCLPGKHMVWFSGWCFGWLCYSWFLAL